MGFWSKVRKGLSVAARVAPVLGKFAGRNVPILNTIIAAVELAEELGPGKGAAKRALAQDLALFALRAIEAAAGRDLFDEKKLAHVLGPFIDLVVTFLNASKWKKA